MNRVNVDYIGVVRTVKDGNVVFTKVPITNEYQELLGTLKDMVSNRNMTVLDMQGHVRPVALTIVIHGHIQLLILEELVIQLVTLIKNIKANYVIAIMKNKCHNH